MSGLDDDAYSLLSKRVYDLAGCTPSRVNIELNGATITRVKDFESYVDMYFDEKKKPTNKYYEKYGDRWEVCVIV